MPLVVMAAHFPPPMHGHSASAAGMAELVSGHAEVLARNIAAPRLDRDAGYHLRRVLRVGRAAATILRPGRPVAGVYVSGDGGRGMLYTLVLVAAARLARRRTYLHHMAYSFLTTPSRVMAAIVRIGGDRLVHLCLCERMAHDLIRVYGARDARVCPVTFTMDDPGWQAPSRGAGAFRLGHFGNLTVEKGLGRVFDTLGELLARGVDARLVVGGPAVGADAEQVLTAGRARYGAAVDYVGPVTGPGRDEVLRHCDAFLFPTLYANESFGLVVWEAMLRGVPVISYRAGCLDGDAIRTGGLVLEPEVPFGTAAADLCQRWIADPATYRDAATSAYELSQQARHAARSAADAVARVIAGGSAA